MVQGKPCPSCPMRIRCLVTKECLIDRGEVSMKELVRAFLETVLTQYTTSLKVGVLIGLLARFLDHFPNHTLARPVESRLFSHVLYNYVSHVIRESDKFHIDSGWIKVKRR